MNAEQKRAWLAITSGIASLVVFAAMAPFVGPVPAAAAFALFAVNGIAPFMRRNDPTDERDRTIARRATLIGAMASYLVFVLGCMGAWFIAYAFSGREQVSVHLLALITGLGGIVLYLARGIAVLTLYGRKLEADDA